MPGLRQREPGEFYEPAGTVICARCGLLFLRDSLGKIGAVEAERSADFDALRERLKVIKDTGADSIAFLELAMELDESGITIEDLKAENVRTLEDLKRFIERSEAIHGRVE